MLAAAALCALGAGAAAAQTMSIEEYDPKSTLVVPEHHPAKAKYPFVDVHNHQDRDMSAEEARKLVADMDRIGMKVMVNLSGGQGAELVKGLASLAGRYPGPVRRLRQRRLQGNRASPAGESARRRSWRRT